MSASEAGKASDASAWVEGFGEETFGHRSSGAGGRDSNGLVLMEKEGKPGLEPGLAGYNLNPADFALPKVRLTWLTSE